VAVSEFCDLILAHKKHPIGHDILQVFLIAPNILQIYEPNPGRYSCLAAVKYKQYISVNYLKHKYENYRAKIKVVLGHYDPIKYMLDCGSIFQ
jgi:hypothetical protein